MTRRLLAMIVVAFVLFPSAALPLDDIQSGLVRFYALPLRWYNIERAPLLVEGHDAVHEDDSPRHLLKIAPGESATIWLPAWESLRIDATKDTLATEDVDVAFSEGGGLFRHDAGLRSKDGKSLLFNPSSPAPILARISRPLRHSAPLSIAAFISFKVPLGEIAPYRGFIPLPLDRIMLGRSGRPGEDVFWKIPGGQAVTISLSGPARVALENRLVFPEQESRRYFMYRVDTAIDGRAVQPLEFEAGPETQPLRYDGNQLRILGRRQTGYLDIPAGEHTVTLKASTTLFGRLLVQERSDYLFPSLNEPSPSAAAMQQKTETPFPGGSFAGLDRKELSRIAGDTGASPVTIEQAALTIARGNEHREGGTTGTALLIKAGETRPDYPDLRERAEELAGFHTFYRELLPAAVTASASPSFRWFVPSRLTEPERHPFGTIVGDQHMPELVRMLSSGTFFNVPAKREEAYRYHLPRRFAPSLLRVTVPAESTGGKGELLIRFDDLPPQRLFLASPPPLPVAAVAVSPAEAGLLLLAERHGSPRPVTLGGGFSEIARPAPLLQAATVEIPLPPDVRTISLWSDGNMVRPLPVALQYRTSAPYRFAETEFLAAESLLLDGNTPFSSFAAALSFQQGMEEKVSASFAPVFDGASIAKREMTGERLPLLRLIRSLERSYTANVSPPPSAGTQLYSDLSGDVASPAEEARSAEKANDWLTALEMRGIQARTGAGTTRREGVFGQIEALIRLNEDFLAEHLLKGLFIYGDEADRSEAFKRLKAFYTSSGDSDALLSLQATALMRHPAPLLLRDFGIALLDAGESELGLQALLILPAAERPRAVMLQSAFRAGWWQIFEQLLAEEGTGNEERALWQGLRLMADGRYAEAVTLLRAGGSAGGEWADHVEKGESIRSCLMDSDNGTRLRAVIDWERWQAAHPGQWMWEPETGAFTAGAGTATLYNGARDTLFTAFRTTAAQPAVFRVAGPARIRIEARPLHPAASKNPLDGWLQVRDGERLYTQPIIRNMPAQGLNLVGDETHSAGLKVERDIEIGPGIHDLQVSGGSLDLLVRINTFRPALPDPLLPVLNRDTLTAALDGLYVPAPSPSSAPIPENERVYRLSEEPGQSRLIPFSRHDLLDNGKEGTSDVPAEALEELASLREPCIEGADGQAALLVGRGDIPGVYQMAAEPSFPDAARRAILLLWIAEQDPKYYLPSLSVARMMAASPAAVPGLTPVIDRLSRRSNWVPVTGIASSAGIRTIEVTGWRPETPALRVRRALLRPAADNEHLLSDTGRMVFTMYNKTATTVEMTLSVDEPGFLPPEPLAMSWQLDREPQQRLTLRPGEPVRKVSVTVPRGEHVIRVGIDERFSDQFLRVGLQETPVKAGKKSAGMKPVIAKIERSYQAATRREPVRLLVEGPSLLRIDELRNGTTAVSYRIIEPGLQPVEITPGKDREEGLYRFFTHQIVAEKPAMPVRSVEVAQTPVPPPPIEVRMPAKPGAFSFTDAFTPGRQEDGTWSITGALVRRKPVHEGIDEDLSPEQFLETSATYRYFNGERTYYKSGALLRIRENGGPTLGVQGEVTQHPLTLPFTWSLGGNLYLQHPAGDTIRPLDHSLEGAASLYGSIYQVRELGPKTWHTPSASLFGRVLSRSDLSRYLRKDVDQDVFTHYKADHLYGAFFSETLTHRPWLDTLWQGTATLATNELKDGLRPDHVSLSLGWKQLLKEFQVKALYRVSEYLGDSDRTSTFFRNSLGLEVILNRWLRNYDRLEVGTRINWHMETSDFTSLITLTWHINNGRGFRDFLPGENDFEDLRHRMAPSGPNNGITYEQ